MDEEKPGAEPETMSEILSTPPLDEPAELPVERPTAPPPPVEAKPPAAAPAPRPPEVRADRGRAPRPEMLESREPLYRESGGYTLRLDPPDLARLRELPGSKGKTDRELGDQFLDGQAARLTGAVSGDVPVPAELRVVVDPYSRQAFLAVGKTIRGIISF